MKKEYIPDKGRSLPVDPNLPKWVCQNCHHSLCIVGVDSYVHKFPYDASRPAMQGSSIHGASSVLGSSRMDNSFVVLPKQKPLAPGIPPRPRGVPGQSDAGQPRKEGGPSSSLQPNNSGFHSTITVLKNAFEIATTQTQVEQPLCLECMRVLSESDKLDKEVEDVTRDIDSYEACLQRLEGEPQDVLTEADFLKEKLKNAKHTLICISPGFLIIRSLCLLESMCNRYWQEFNNFQFQLISHQEERDAISAKTEVSQAHLELLKRTNVLNGAFPIWHEGEFGTINNFRLGKLPKIPVEWDEINAAWGQACLLLHTMCQYFRPKFHYRIKIIPLGSYPRIMDSNNNTYELFDPVNLFWSTRYNKAMTLFLTCLKDFAEFANAKDLENNIPPEKCFNLPYKIENDKVENYSITQSFNKQENWTKALKYILCNLKWALYWFIGSTNFQPLSGTVTSVTEVSAAGSLYAKRSSDPKSEARKPSNS
ncbi:hypothetical protein V6N13_138039 [Hibiscus sabdariffa]